MKGLLIKDFKLLIMQTRFFLLMVVLMAAMGFGTGKLSFVNGYLMLVIPLFALSTISYDEFDNGYPFLFTLPVSRKMYVLSKYCFCFLLSAAAMVVTLLLSILVSVTNPTVLLAESLMVFPASAAGMVLILSVMIPANLKFGSEKGRIVLIVVVAFVSALGYGLTNLLAESGIELTPAIEAVLRLPTALLIALGAVLVIAMLGISIQISTAIMEKKEF